MLCLDLNERIAEQRAAVRLSRLLEVFKVARALEKSLRRLGPREYEIDPGAVLALRTTLTEAALVMRKDTD